jgi:tRNA dimethylallyltransferase
VLKYQTPIIRWASTRVLVCAQALPQCLWFGIYIYIGYKDFRPYLDTEDAGSPNDQLFADAVAATKTSTRQYAKRQVSWLRNKLLPAVRAANSQAQLEPGDNTQPVPTYLLDATGMFS